MNEVINNRYQLNELLGQGGMGAVYRAYDRLTGQDIALKRVTAPSQNLEIVSRMSKGGSLSLALANEFRTLASMRHPNIINVLDYGFEANLQPFFTMQLLEHAIEIGDVAKSKQFSEKIALLVQVLQALNYLHRRGILHRDLKPSNVLVRNQEVYLLDFGLALDAAYASSRGDTAGTLAYLAPEVLMGKSPSIASDLYAFGVLAYEILLGEHPYNFNSNSELVQQVLTSQVSIDEARMDDALGAVIMRLLSKNPEDRYSSSLDALRALCDAGDYPMPKETEEIRESFLVAASFVGREEEMASLNLALEQALTGKGQAWLIAGESGVGKSRLMDELRSLALVRGTIALRGQGVSEGGLPYQLWREIIRHLLLMVDITDEEAYVLKGIVPDIDTLLQRPILDLGYQNQTIQKRLPLLILNILSEASSQRPLVLLLEDLQWAGESLDILEQILPAISQYPILILANYRSDESPHLRERFSSIKFMELRRLSEKSIRELSKAMLGDTGAQENVVELIQRESEGNAFFIVEVVRVLAEEAGQLSDIGRSTLPAQIFAGGVQRIIERRLAKLPAWALYPTQVAAVFGRQINSQIIKEIVKELDTDTWLTVANDAAVFSVNGDTWQFAHDKLREYVYDNLEIEQKREIHALVGKAIESVYADALKAYAAILVNHFAMAGDETKEAHYANIAAPELLTINPHESRRLIKRAMALNAHQVFEKPQEQLAAMYRILGRSNLLISEYTEARQALDESRRITETVQDRMGLATTKQLLGELGFLTGIFSDALPLLEEALEVFLPTDDWSNIGYCYMNLGVIASRQDKAELAREYFKKCLEAMEKTGDSLVIAQALNNLGINYDMAGEWDEAVRLYNRSLELRRQIKDKRGIIYSLTNLGALAFDQERYEDAKNLRLDALVLAREIQDRRSLASILDSLGMAEMRAKNYGAALSYIEEAADYARQINEAFLQPQIVRNLGKIYEQLGEDPSPYYFESLEITRRFEITNRKLEAIQTLADWYKRQKQYANAVRLYAHLSLHEGSNQEADAKEAINEIREHLSEDEYQSSVEKTEKELDDFIDELLRERGLKA